MRLLRSFYLVAPMCVCRETWFGGAYRLCGVKSLREERVLELVALTFNNASVFLIYLVRVCRTGNHDPVFT